MKGTDPPDIPPQFLVSSLRVALEPKEGVSHQQGACRPGCVVMGVVVITDTLSWKECDRHGLRGSASMLISVLVPPIAFSSNSHSRDPRRI